MRTYCPFRLGLFLVIALLVWAQAAPARAGAAGDWRRVDPGFAPQVLFGQGSAMWAAGSGESIAVSLDAGKSWKIKHQDADGALLFVLQFVGEKFGFAAGTGGKVLFSEDGGATWTARKLADETILQAAFGDEMHGVIRTISALEATTDGGKSWQVLSAANDAECLAKFPFTVNMAALDANRLAVRLSQGPLSDGEYIWTADGGASWHANYLANVGIHDLFVADGSYVSTGHEVLGKERPGGGLGYAMAFRSADGVQWEHLSQAESACKSEQCNGCNAQGCLVGNGWLVRPAFLSVQLDATAKKSGESLWRFAPHEGLSSQWAVIGETFCLLSHGAVECTQLQAADKYAGGEIAATWEDRSYPPLGRMRKTSPQCIRCQLNPVFITRTGESGPVDAQISFVLNPTGSLDGILCEGNLPPDVKDQVLAAVQGWLFEPVVRDGHVASVRETMKARVMVINPEKLQRH